MNNLQLQTSTLETNPKMKAHQAPQAHPPQMTLQQPLETHQPQEKQRRAKRRRREELKNIKKIHEAFQQTVQVSITSQTEDPQIGWNT